MDDLRSILYYPLGLLPGIFFALRFFIQWIQSEKSEKSIVTDLFWKLSLAGNILAGVHYLIQLQSIYFVLQLGNGFIAWRNMNLTKSKFSVKLVSIIIAIFFISLLGAFLYQINFGDAVFLSNAKVSIAWSIVGGVGAALFAARFWVQWWQAERQQASQLNKSFWILSILGGIISIVYAIKINDTVSILNFSCGMIPYTRNLILLLKR